MNADPRRALAIAAASAGLFGLAGVVGMAPLTLVALLAVFGLACLSPQGSLAGAVATLPYFYRPLDVGGMQFAASELLLVAAAFGTVFEMARNAIARREISVRESVDRVLRCVRSPLFLLALALVLLGGALVAFPYDLAHRSESLREWRWVLAEPLLLLGLLIWHSQRRWLAWVVALALLGGGAVASVHALADFALGGGVSVGGVTRIAGPYPHPNALALLTVRIAALGLVWAWLDPRVRKIVGPLMIVCGLTVAATFSRGAMLAGLVPVAYVLFQAPRQLRLAGVGAVAAGLVAAILLARDRMLDLFDGGSGSLRLDIWSSALEMIDDRPVQGYGPDQFLYAYLPRYVQPTAWGERFTAHAHNFLLDFWVRLGIIGAAIAGMVALLCLLSLARRIRDRNTTPRPLAMAAHVALIATFTHGLVDNAFFAHDLAMSAWLLAWLAFGHYPDGAGTEGGFDVARAGVGRSRIHRIASLR